VVTAIDYDDEDHKVPSRPAAAQGSPAAQAAAVRATGLSLDPQPMSLATMMAAAATLLQQQARSTPSMAGLAQSLPMTQLLSAYGTEEPGAAGKRGSNIFTTSKPGQLQFNIRLPGIAVGQPQMHWGD